MDIDCNSNGEMETIQFGDRYFFHFVRLLDAKEISEIGIGKDANVTEVANYIKFIKSGENIHLVVRIDKDEEATAVDVKILHANLFLIPYYSEPTGKGSEYSSFLTFVIISARIYARGSKWYK